MTAIAVIVGAAYYSSKIFVARPCSTACNAGLHAISSVQKIGFIADRDTRGTSRGEKGKGLNRQTNESHCDAAPPKCGMPRSLLRRSTQLLSVSDLPSIEAASPEKPQGKGKETYQPIPSDLGDE